MRELWEDTWFGTGDFDGDEYQHPLIYPHPVTKEREPAMVFHLGVGKCWGLYQGEQMEQLPGARRMLDTDAMYSLLNDLSNRLFDPSRMLAVGWRKGGVAFLDNTHNRDSLQWTRGCTRKIRWVGGDRWVNIPFEKQPPTYCPPISTRGCRLAAAHLVLMWC